jgi:predicted MFS family arabinose efflux permease
MISDFVKEEQRAKSMAIMGGSIAVSFALAMVLGPTIGGHFGVDTLFWIVTILVFVSIVILIKFVPQVPQIEHTYHGKTNFSDVLKNPNLNRMNITNFLQKALMTFTFMIIPIILTIHFNWQTSELWKVYIPAMIFGVGAMGPAAIFAEKRGKFKEILSVGILFFLVSYLLMGQSQGSETLFLISIILFFIGFNMHEPIMQSLTTRFVKVHQKGTALGIFNSFGYFGTFVGGLIGGMAFDDISDISNISIYITIISILWLILIITMANPHHKKLLYLDIDRCNKDRFESLENVDEWYLNNTENILVVKYDKDLIDEAKIKAMVEYNE